MKLGTKIILGFSALIALALALGGLAVWKMTGVKKDAKVLAVDYMPAIVVANNVERESLKTMYEMRGYAYTEDSNFLKGAQQNLADVKQRLQEAKTLATKSGETLSFLKQAADKAEAKALEYEQLANQTVTVTEALNKDRAAMDVAAQKYMKECEDYLANQDLKLKEALGVDAKTGASATNTLDAVEALDRVKKMAIANDIIDLGNAVRLGNFKSQATRDPELFRETQKKFVQVNQKLDELKALTKQEANLKQIEACRAAGQAYNDAMSSFLSNWLAREELGKKRGTVADAVLAEAQNTATGSADNSGKTATTAASSLATASTTMMVGLVIAIALGVGLALALTRSITRPIRLVATALSDGADQTASASGQVSTASQSLAEGASEQAASLEETSSSLEEMASMTRRNAEGAQKANALAKQARTAADAGASDMQQMAVAMDAIKSSSDDVAKIIKTIDEIAFQTNILALNAAVEAARAGEAGMGFAVVADEVRSLAQRSAQAAKETATMIEGAISKTALGVEITAKVAKGLQEIVDKARQVDELAAEVASASQEQSQGISQVNTAVSQMDKVVQSNAASAEESASAAEELNAQADALKEAVAELMRLVDGQDAGKGQSAAKPQPLPERKSVTAAFNRRPAVNGTNGNGAAHPAKPSRGVKTPAKAGEIAQADAELEHAFRDF